MKCQGTALLKNMTSHMTEKYLLLFPFPHTTMLLKLKHLKISSNMDIFLSHFH